MPEMSPEVDLLERLSAEDASLHEAAHASCYAFADLAHAKRAVALYLKTGIVELYENQSESQAAIPFHAGRWILDDDSNWERGSAYSIRITDDGYRKFVEDSQGFFDELFRNT
jgi:hypothetical protein